MSSSSFFDIFQINCNRLEELLSHWFILCKFRNKSKLVCNLGFLFVVVAYYICKSTNCIRIKGHTNTDPYDIKDFFDISFA